MPHTGTSVLYITKEKEEQGTREKYGPPGEGKLFYSFIQLIAAQVALMNAQGAGELSGVFLRLGERVIKPGKLLVPQTTSLQTQPPPPRKYTA